MIPLEFNAFALMSTSLEFREAINGAIFILCLNMTLMLGWYINRAWQVYGPRWMREEGMATACVLFWLFAIIGLRCGFVWLAIWLETAGLVMSQTVEQIATLSLIGSGLGLIAVTLRAIYLYTPIKWHHLAWLISAAMAALFVAFSHLYP